MPVIDDTIHTKEIKEFKAEVRSILEDFKSRLDALVGKTEDAEAPKRGRSKGS